ncbi:PrsW family intramembrane metalloprotease [Pendulispora rubella]|uniref:PrsW family intramembrane metalloprotease n=1 Tax=Pendulispora rubella TaxID=2741070 RepID=A0ABZ2LJ86_9BACT
MNHAPYRWLLWLSTAWTLCLFCVGCGELQLAQTHDVELVYRATAPAAKDTAARVRARLGAARVPADVREKDGEIHVTVDHDLAESADTYLRWRGGVTLHRVDEVGRPLEPPLVDFADRIARVEASRHGHDLTIFTTVTMRTPPKEPLAIVLAGKVLATQRIENAPSLTVSFGDDLDSYARADRARMLIGSPSLPALTQVATQAVPPRWGIGILGLLLPILLSVGWLSFVRRFDRARPEPGWLVGVTFALGGVSALLAGVVQYGLIHLSPYLHPTTMTFGGQLVAAPLALLVFTVVVGLTEEGSKWLGVWSFARHRREFDEPVDGIVYGVASSLGFAAVENIRYFALGRLATGLVVLRTFTSLPAHMFFGAIWGYALGRKLVAPRTSNLKFVLLAALCHGAYDTFLSVHRLEYATLLLHFALTTLFVALLRRALRRGVVAPGGSVPESSRRLSFALGSSKIFALWAISLHLVAVAIVALGLYFDARSQSVNLAFLTAGTGLLVLFAVAAHGLVATLPLEAVVDENGVTFGGASRSWDEIRSFDRYRAPVSLGVVGEAYEIVVHSSKGPLRIGPGSDDATTTLAACLSSFIRPQ